MQSISRKGSAEKSADPFHIENSKGIYITAKCPLRHLALGDAFLFIFKVAIGAAEDLTAHADQSDQIGDRHQGAKNIR